MSAATMATVAACPRMVSATAGKLLSRPRQTQGRLLLCRSLFQMTAPRLAKKPANTYSSRVVALPKAGAPKPKAKPKAKPGPKSSPKAPPIAQSSWFAKPIKPQGGPQPTPADAAGAAAPQPPPSPKKQSPPPSPPPSPPKKAKAAEEQPPSAKDSSSRNSSRKNKKKQPLTTLLAQRRTALVGAALAAGVLGFYITPLLVTYLTGGCSSCAGEGGKDIPSDAVPTGLPPVSAAAFDASLDMPEWVTGVKTLRKQLAEEAEGAVLEVAVGTGRNVEYLAWAADKAEAAADAQKGAATPTTATTTTTGVTSFTGVDLSEDALEMARQRLRTSVPGAKAVIRKTKKTAETARSSASASTSTSTNSFQDATAENDKVGKPNKSTTTATPPPTAEVLNVLEGRVRLFRGDALQPLPPAIDAGTSKSSASSFSLFRSSSSSSSNKYDTILQTFGICSVADPVALLANMAAAVRPDTGRILLLEHGRGRWDVVNSLLDRYAGAHFARFGCWWNRDMRAIVEQAAAKVPGLEVVAVRRPGRMQFGTLWFIELKVVSSPSPSKSAKTSKSS